MKKPPVSGGFFFVCENKTMRARTPNSTSAIRPARTQAIIWPRVYTWPDDCHSDDDADPEPYGLDVI